MRNYKLLPLLLVISSLTACTENQLIVWKDATDFAVSEYGQKIEEQMKKDLLTLSMVSDITLWKNRDNYVTDGNYSLELDCAKTLVHFKGSFTPEGESLINDEGWIASDNTYVFLYRECNGEKYRERICKHNENKTELLLTLKDYLDEFIGTQFLDGYIDKINTIGGYGKDYVFIPEKLKPVTNFENLQIGKNKDGYLRYTMTTNNREAYRIGDVTEMYDIRRDVTINDNFLTVMSDDTEQKYILPGNSQENSIKTSLVVKNTKAKVSIVLPDLTEFD